MKNILRIFSFDGEATRKEWWIVYGSFWLILFVIAQIEILLYGDKEDPSIFFMIVFFSFLWPLFATQVRRWHDRNKSGAWCLINLVPFIGGIWSFIELGFLPSKKHNPYLGRNH